MLREEVLERWDNCKTKLASVCLTSQEKEFWKFMRISKTGGFSTFDHRNDDLEDLEKTVRTEKNKDWGPEENDMLIDYWLCWSNFGSLILDWISLKQTNDGLKGRIDDLERHLYTLDNSTTDVFELVKIKLSPNNGSSLYCSTIEPIGGLDDVKAFNVACSRNICRVDVEYKVIKVLPLQVIKKSEISNVYQSNELRREERPQVPINSILPAWLPSGPTIEEVD